MKKTITTVSNFNVNPCKYPINIKFSCFDVLTGDELSGFNILINGNILLDTEYSCSTNESFNPNRYEYFINSLSTKNITLIVDKIGYFPYSNKFILNSTSIFDEPETIDLGRVPLLSEIKSNAVVLTWGQYPVDLDAKLINPDGSMTSITAQGGEMKTYYSLVDIDDTASFGPETISFSQWVDWESKYKVVGTFNYRVNWRENRRNPVRGSGDRRVRSKCKTFYKW